MSPTVTYTAQGDPREHQARLSERTVTGSENVLRAILALRHYGEADLSDLIHVVKIERPERIDPLTTPPHILNQHLAEAQAEDE